MREITEQELEQALEEPRSFAYFGTNDNLFLTWSLGPTILTRDSNLIEQSNRDAMLDELERLAKEGKISSDDYALERCSHWGPGWVEHLSFRAMGDDGQATPILSHIMEMCDTIQEHVVLDSSDYFRREYEAQLESIEQNAPALRDDLPEDWPTQVFGWLWEHDQNEAFDGDDRTFIAPEYVEKACEALGFAEEEDED